MPFERALDIARARTRSLKRLARIAGSDPYDFYRFADLIGLDLRGQDLTAMDLTGARIDGVRIDAQTRADPPFGRLLFSSAVAQLSLEIDEALAQSPTDGRIAGARLVELAALNQSFGDPGDAVQNLDTLLQLGVPPPLDIEAIQPDLLPGKVAELLLERWADAYSAETTFEPILARLVVSPGWRPYALWVAKRHLDQRTNAGPELLLVMATYVGRTDVLKSLWDWARRQEFTETTAPILTRLIVRIPDQPILRDWTRRTLTSRKSDATYRAIFSISLLLNRLPDKYSVPAHWVRGRGRNPIRGVDAYDNLVRVMSDVVEILTLVPRSIADDLLQAMVIADRGILGSPSVRAKLGVDMFPEIEQSVLAGARRRTHQLIDLAEQRMGGRHSAMPSNLARSLVGRFY
jgi:hypothetical protein